MHGIDLDIPEPDHIAPGTFRKSEETPSDTRTIHRRVVSDTVTSYGHQVPEEYAPVLEPLPYPVLIRDSIGRSSQSGRCMSQCILNTTEVPSGPVTTDRSLSKSDPSLEEKNGKSVSVCEQTMSRSPTLWKRPSRLRRRRGSPDPSS